MTALRGALDADFLPTPARLCRAFASMARHKAPGISKIGADVFRAAPHQAALAYFPLAIKTLARGAPPAQWSGGKAVPIPKPGKPAETFAGWRSILLLEADAKALQKVMRGMLVGALEASRAPGQHGGLPGHTLTLPAAAVRAHFLHLRHHNKSGGAIFVDSASAYYAVVRDFLCIPDAERGTKAELLKRAAALYQAAEDQERYVQAMQAGNILEALQAPEELCRFVTCQLRQTWFVTREGGSNVYCTESGTAPGSPIADALFGLIYAKVLARIHESLACKGLNAQICTPSGPASAGEPTWADDTAVLFVSSSASSVCTDLAAATAIVHSGLTSVGLVPNFGPGKTEAVLYWSGKDSRQSRRAVTCADIPGVEFHADGNTMRIRVVPGYVHLGSMLRGDLHEAPAIHHREMLLQAAFQPFKKKLLYNKYLSVPEKVRLLSERVVPRYLYGSGLWRLGTKYELEAAEKPLAQVIRASLRPILGMTCAGIDLHQACAALGLNTPSELLQGERWRAWNELARDADVFTWTALVQDGVWLALAKDAGARILADTGIPIPEMADLAACHQFAVRFQARNKNAIRAYLRRQVQNRAPAGDELKRAMALDLLPVPVPRPPVITLDAAHQCELCPATFDTWRQLATHKAKKHGSWSLARKAAFGTRCELCTLEFWEAGRLREHLRRSPVCLATYWASDVQDEVLKAHPRSPNNFAWKPASRVQGPQPWWATLRPG